MSYFRTIPPWRTPAEAWFATVDGLLQDGMRKVSPRGQDTVEYPSPTIFMVNNPLAVDILAQGRQFRHVIGVVEGLSLVGQTSVPEVILDKVAAFRPFMRRSVFWGAYGPRAAGDVGQVVDLLTKDPDSRQAVVSLYDSDRDLGRVEQVDVPCTISLQYLVREGRLEAVTSMRSNDAWLGLPYDLMQFGMLQGAIAQSIGLPPGKATHVAASMHLYERNRADALKVTGPLAPSGLGDKLWGADDIGEIASRARRILLGQGYQLDGLTVFEDWAADLLS